MSASDRRFLALLVSLAVAAIIFGCLSFLSLFHDLVRERELGLEPLPNVITTQPNLQ